MDNKVTIVDLESDEIEKQASSGNIGVAGELAPDTLLTYALDYNFGHIVQKSGPNAESEMEAAKLILQDRQKFLDYPLSSVLVPQKAGEEAEKEIQLLEFSFNNSKQKKEILDQLEEKLSEFTRSRSLICDVCLVADELFTNAVYNASFVDIENTLSGISRDLPEVKMKVGHSGRMALGLFEDRLVLSCEDSLGALNLKRQLERIKRCYDDGASRVINLSSEGGAKIGSYLIFQSCMSYYAVVDVGVKTGICCTFPLKMSNRKRNSMPKNLHTS